MDKEKYTGNVDQFEKAGAKAAKVFGRFVRVASEMTDELKREYEKEVTRHGDEQSAAPSMDVPDVYSQNENSVEEANVVEIPSDSSRLNRLSELFSNDPDIAEMSEEQFDSLLQYMQGSYLQAKAMIKQ